MGSEDDTDVEAGAAQPVPEALSPGGGPAVAAELDQIEPMLARLDSVPVADHVAVYTDLQRRLAAALAGTSGATGPGDPRPEEPNVRHGQPNVAQPYRPPGPPSARSG